MIPANKNALFDSFFYVYFRRMARRAFHTIAGRGLERLHKLPDDRPVIVFCNHTNWWDAVFVFLLTRQMPHKSVFCMMEEKQLAQYLFFARLGAFSVDLNSPRRAAISLRYALRLLQKKETVMWLFPQGKIIPPGEPIEARPGTDYLAKHTPNALLVPVAFRFDFFREDRPNALIEVGQPFPARELTEGRIARECNEAFARLSQAAAAQDLTGFSVMFPPRWTINKRWEWVKRALTGRLSGFDANN